VSVQRSVVFRVVGGIAILLILMLAGRELAGYVPRFATWVEDRGTAGAVAFVIGYTVATVAFVPGSLLTLAAGAVFGIARGTLLVFLGATIGETVAFLLARHAIRSRIEQRVRQDPRFARLDDAIAQEGRRIVLLLRLSPVFPFNLLNYALGLTRIRVRDYIIASIGILPGTLLYVYLGKVIGDVAAIAAGVMPPAGAGYWIVLGVGLLATIAVTILIARIARRTLRNAL